jgi:6-pyruvoyltetrahydropterin/6-carboxytetrahydropterin synthase
MVVSKLFAFEAAHWLPRHPGKCRRLHGHSYQVEVKLEGPVVEETGFVLDYGDLKAMVQPTIDLWDHRLLNSFINYSSAENIAAHLAHMIRAKMFTANTPMLNETTNRLVVSVSETRSTWSVWDSAVREDVLMLDNAGPNAGWRSPMCDIPLIDSDKFQAELAEMDKHIEDVLGTLTSTMITREQLLLYRESLVDPHLDDIGIGKGKIQ